MNTGIDMTLYWTEFFRFLARRAQFLADSLALKTKIWVDDQTLRIGEYTIRPKMKVTPKGNQIGLEVVIEGLRSKGRSTITEGRVDVGENLVVSVFLRIVQDRYYQMTKPVSTAQVLQMLHTGARVD